MLSDWIQARYIVSKTTYPNFFNVLLSYFIVCRWRQQFSRLTTLVLLMIVLTKSSGCQHKLVYNLWNKLEIQVVVVSYIISSFSDHLGWLELNWTKVILFELIFILHELCRSWFGFTWPLTHSLLCWLMLSKYFHSDYI